MLLYAEDHFHRLNICGVEIDRLPRSLPPPSATSHTYIVHASLRRCNHAECTQNDVAKALRSEHIPSDNRRVIGRAENGTGRHMNFDRLQAALVQWDGTADQAAQTIDDGSHQHSWRCVAAGVHLQTSTRKVECRIALLNVRMKF